jgi:class 3 adenylate cyclase
MSSKNLNAQLLDAKLAEISAARPFNSRMIAELRSWIAIADDYDLFRANPIQFAREKSLADDDCIALFLYTAKYGLFEMEWHMLCAFCGHIVENLQDLSKAHAHFVCDFCGAENAASLDEYIHVGFTLSPQIRANAYLEPESLPAADFYLKHQFAKGVIFAGGHSLEEVGAHLTRFMADVEPQAALDFELAAEPGTLQVKDLRNKASSTFVLAPAAAGGPRRLAIDLEGGAFLANGARATPVTMNFRVAPFHIEMAGELAAGQLQVAFRNRMDKKSALWVMQFPPGFESDYVQFESFLSGKRLITTQTFRDLFRFETVPTTEGIDIKDVTFMFTDLKGSTALYDRIGDLKAYYLVRQHFETLAAVIDRHAGAIVKTIGDAVMASFADPQDAVQAALEVYREIRAFNATISDAIILKIGLHRGHAIVVSLNDHLDFFGQTVNVAARVQALADAGEILLSAAVHKAPGVQEALQGREIAAEQVVVRGVRDRLDVFRVSAQP